MPNRRFVVIGISLLVLALSPRDAAAQRSAVLPDDWRESSQTFNAWTGECQMQRGPGCILGNTYLLQTAGEVPAAGDVLVKVSSSARPEAHQLLFAPFEGRCVGGTVTIDEAPSLTLAADRNYCQPESIIFRDTISNATRQAELDLLRQAETLTVTLDLEDGTTMSFMVSMDGFAEALEAAMH